MQLIMLLLGLLGLFAHASPIDKRAGAGGPIGKPIPSNCTVTNPLPHSNCSIATVSGYKPNSNFTSSHTLYESYFDLPTPAKDLWDQCSQQCYGYGEEGDCKSAVLAYDVPVSEGYHGGPGGELLIACLLFDQHLTPDDFEGAEEGQWVEETAGSIYCGY